MDRDESDIGQPNDGSLDGQRELYAYVYRRRWLSLADGGGRGDRGGADANPDGVPDDGSIGKRVEPDLEYDQRDELRSIRFLERCQGNLRYPEYRYSHSQFELHAGVRGRRRHGDAVSHRDSDRRDAVSDAHCESAWGCTQHLNDVVVDQREC